MKHISIIADTIPSYLSVAPEIRAAKTRQARSRRWTTLYERPNSDLFNTYYKWAPKRFRSSILADYQNLYDEKKIDKFTTLLDALLDPAAGAVRKMIPYRGKIPVIKFVGIHVTNGFVHMHKGTYTLFMNLEAYPDKRSLELFLTHELAHAAHLLTNDIYYFSGQKQDWYRTLILEGVATYVTKQLHNISGAEALWANYLDPAKRTAFMRYCKNHEAKLRQALYATIHHTRRIESPFFGGKTPKGIPYYRTGYYLGLRFIEELRKEFAFAEIISLRGNALRKNVNAFLLNER